MVGIMNTPIPRGGLDSRNIDAELRKEAELHLKKLKNRSKANTISQYTPEAGEAEKFYDRKLQLIEEQNAPLNKFAESKAAGNLEDAMMFAADILSIGEAAGVAKNLFKKIPKFNLSKKAVPDSKYNLLGDAASTIVNKQTGKTQFFDKQGAEIGSISMRSPQAVSEYNKSLKNQLRTGATPAPPEWLRPY